MIERGAHSDDDNDGTNPSLFGSAIPDYILEGPDGDLYRRALAQIDKLVDLYDKAMSNPDEASLKLFTDAIYVAISSNDKATATIISAGISAMWIVKKMTGK